MDREESRPWQPGKSKVNEVTKVGNRIEMVRTQKFQKYAYITAFNYCKI